MNYTEQQRAILAQYEEYFGTAVRSDWARNPGPRALEEINDILYAGKTAKPRVNNGCQQCILGILRDAGRLYFADLAEIEKNAQISTQTDKDDKSTAPTENAPKSGRKQVKKQEKKKK